MSWCSHYEIIHFHQLHTLLTTANSNTRNSKDKMVHFIDFTRWSHNSNYTNIFNKLHLNSDPELFITNTGY